MSVQDIESPSGLDLEPKPPETARVSPRVAWAIIGFGAVVLLLIVYGLYSRSEHAKVTQAAAEEKRPQAATAEADQLVNDLAPPAVAKPAPARPPGALVPPIDPSVQTRGVSHGPDVPDLTYHGQNGIVSSSSSQPGNNELTAEEKALVETYHQEQEALAAPTVVRTSFASASGNQSGSVTSSADPAQQLAQLLGLQPQSSQSSAAALGKLLQSSASGPASSSAEASTFEAQNGQANKEEFLEKVRNREVDNYLKSTRMSALGRYEIKAGWDIPAIMEQGINSDLPGEVKALVRSNVYDTATGKYLLIPQGSRLIGLYDSHVTYGQNRLQVVWDRIIFPDASSINLDGMLGQDAAGMAGLHDKVDNHYKRLVGFAALTSLFAAGIELSQRRGSNNTLLTEPTIGQTVSQSLGQQLGEMGMQVTERNLNIQPTLKVPVGYRFNVRVNKDLLFETPYLPVRP